MHASRFLQCLFAGTLLSVFWASLAQGAKTLTLEESIEIAQQTNLSIQTLQEKVRTAEAQARAARANLLPNVSINSSYTYFKNLPKSVLEFSGGGFPVPPEAAGAGNDSESSSVEIEFGARRNLQGTLTLRQPLFAWGRYYYNYQSAQLNVEAARKELEAAYNQLSLNVSEAFYGVLVAMEFVGVAQQTVDLVEKQLQISQSLFNSGAATHFDVLRAEVQLANAKSHLIRAQNNVRIANDAYKNILNIDLDEEISVKGSFEPPQVERSEDSENRNERSEIPQSGVELNLESLLQTAMEKRPEIHQLEFSERANQKRLDVAKTGNRPDLSFFANYQVDDNEKLTEMNRIWNVRFVLNIPIFDGFATRATVQQAKSGLNQTHLAKQQLRDAIEFEVRSAYLKLLETKALIEVQKETVEQAQEGVRLANLRYENGMLTSVELMDAQLALAQAEVNRLQSTHDYMAGLARLEKAIGTKIGY